MRRAWPIYLLFPVAACAQPVCTAWIRAQRPPGATPTLTRILPEVHEVACGESSVEIRSAGTSLYQFGLLSNPVNPGNEIRDVRIVLPRQPTPESHAHTSLPPGPTGIFVNGVPIDNHLESDSFEGRNLWHYDLISERGVETGHSGMTPMLAKLLSDGSRHSPIIGFALDGYPIYGPWGYVDAKNGSVKRMRSGYRLRAIAERTTWPDGTKLTPGQYGPPVDSNNPLGTFSEDYEFVEGVGDLDNYNGRYAVTPEYPEGTYAYFVSTDSQGRLAFPYVLGTHYYGHLPTDDLATVRLGERAGLSFGASRADLQSDAQVTFVFDFAARALEYVHEKPIHLIVVSEDMSDFSHIHPERTAGESYRVAHTFEHGGHYRLYAEFTLPGEGPRVEAFDVHVAGPARRAIPLEVTSTSRQAPAGLAARLDTVTPIRAGVDQTLTFRLSSTVGLEPYLGAWGHFVLIENGMRNFIHAHPMASVGKVSEPALPHQHSAIPSTEPPPEKIEVPVAFPHSGLYKLWAQFQINGEVEVIPFVLRVEPNSSGKAVTKAPPKGAIAMTVGSAGFSPARLEIPAGKAVTLAVTRNMQPNCAGRIVFPDLAIDRELPPGRTVLIQLPPLAAKELKFACGMGMYRGLLVVK